ncbi:MAG: hypothetical protein IT445_07700 [Phycisphaeraceae bacterium]|nr:hypothetical protein [Phycisphaeraceae bacterium]
MSVLTDCLNLADRMHRELARGWNTWDTHSVLRHVLLPEGLAISLGVAAHDRLVWMGDAFPGREEQTRTAGTRLTSLGKQLPVTNTVEVRPGPRCYDGSYTQLELDLRGARFRVQTSAEGDNWTALITPLQNEPWPRALAVQVGVLWGLPGYAQRVDDHRIIAHLPHRTIDIYADGEPFVDPNLPVMSPYLALRLDRPVALSAGRKVSIEQAQAVIAKAAQAEAATHRVYGELAEAHEAMQSCLAWNVIYDPKHRRVICPVARDWNCKRGGYALFCWDSFFGAWMIAKDQPTLGYACAIETFRGMVDESFIPNVTQGTGRTSRDRSQPPVAGLCLLGMQRQHPRQDVITALWPALMAWNHWWDKARQNSQGTISLGSNPCQPQVGDPAEFIQPNTGEGAAIESGLDNSHMYDHPPFDAQSHLMLIEDVGMTSLYVADCQALAELARLIERHDDAVELSARADRYQSALRHLWSDEEGIYLNRRLDSGKWWPHRSPTSFYPLLTDAVSPRQLERLISEHFMNEQEYFGEWMLPVTPRHHPAFQEQLYQRGRVWPPVNFLVYLGMLRHPCQEARHLLVDKSLRLLLGNWREHGIVAETYSATDGSGGRGQYTHPLYAWGGLLGFMAMIEQGMVPAPFETVGNLTSTK